jgi:hypothetical protein
MVDVARRLCEDNRIYISEIWSYHAIADQIRFTMVYRNKEAPPQVPRKPAAPKKAATPSQKAPAVARKKAAPKKTAAKKKKK